MENVQQKLEIKIQIAGKDLIPVSATKECDALVVRASDIKSVTTAESNQAAGEVVTAMRTHSKTITAERMKRTKVLDDAKKLLMNFFGSHNEPLEKEIERLQRLGTDYLNAENRRVAAEEEKRRKEFEAAQQAQFSATTPAQEMIARRKVQNIIATPEPEANRTKGQTMKQVLKWEVTDLMLLVKHNPQLCKIEPSPSAIKSTCHPNLPIPGLRCWFENEAIYTTR